MSLIYIDIIYGILDYPCIDVLYFSILLYLDILLSKFFVANTICVDRFSIVSQFFDECFYLLLVIFLISVIFDIESMPLILLVSFSKL